MKSKIVQISSEFISNVLFVFKLKHVQRMQPYLFTNDPVSRNLENIPWEFYLTCYLPL